MDESQHLSLNKSFTRSEPNLNVLHYRQVLVTELQKPDGNGQLLRQCSYQEVSSRCFGNQPPIYNFYSPDISKGQHSNFPMLGDYTNDSTHEKKFNYSPMDVDDSDLSGEHEDKWVSVTDSTYLDRRKLHIQQDGDTADGNRSEEEFIQKSLAQTSQSQLHGSPKDNFSNGKLILALCCGIAIIAAAFCYNNSLGLKDVPVSEIEMDLRSSVSNQNHVIDAIIENLNSVNSATRFRKVLTLAGRTGVGKSFVLNQMRRKYSNSAYVSLTYSVHKALIEQSANISFPDDCFLLSIDDLRLVDVETVAAFIDSIAHNCVLIVPVFNVQETTDMITHTNRNDQELRKYFKEKFPNSETVLFNSMNSNDLEIYLREKLDERGLNFNDHHVFVRSVLDHHDVENFGFKGVLPKINLLS